MSWRRWAGPTSTSYLGRTNSTLLETAEEEEQITMGKKMDPIIHFEIPAKDFQRICAFYESALAGRPTRLARKRAAL